MLARTADVLGREVVDLPRVIDEGSAMPILNQAWRDVLDAAAAGVPTAERAGDLVALLREIKAIEDALRETAAAQQMSRFQRVRSALAELQQVGTMTELVRQAPMAAGLIGFDRVLLSRIEESTWIPETIHADRDRAWAEEIVEAGRASPRVLDGSLLETRIVRRNRPLAVADTADRSDLHLAMIRSARTRSYVAAPLVNDGRVVGFLHADCYVQGRRVADADRDLLWMFSDGLSHLIARAKTLDDMESLRASLRHLLGPSNSADRGFGVHVVAAAEGPASSQLFAVPRQSHDAAPAADAWSVLTRREIDVIRLMSDGQTNGKIARRLLISEGTVKSHVKNILRKMEAGNRAEAVSRWLRDQHAYRTMGSPARGVG